MDEIEGDRYHHKDNQGGRIPLFIAENVLGWAELRKKFAKVPQLDTIDDWALKYTEVTGHPELRAVLARFAARNIARAEIELDPALFAVSSGATAILELISWILCESDDVVGIPAPAYPVYTKDINIKANLQRLDIESKPSSGCTPGIHPISLEDIVKAHESRPCRMIILTQPDNPTGAIYTQEQLRSICKWGIENQIHIVVNEIYALSSIDVTNEVISKDYGEYGNTPFSSVLPIIEEEKSDYLHWIYSFSKDFGMSGFRVGVLYTRNETLISAVGNVGGPHEVSNQTQWTLMHLISDTKWIDYYCSHIRARLTESYALAVSTLKRLGIPYSASRGSLFIWMNLGGLLSGNDETELWHTVYQSTKILLTAPGSFGNSEKGWLRMVFTCVDADELTEALTRFSQFYETAVAAQKK